MLLKNTSDGHICIKQMKQAAVNTTKAKENNIYSC